GCITLTLQKNPEIPRGDYILCLDVEKKVVDEIKKLTDRPIYCISRKILNFYSFQERFKIAKMILRMYHNAALNVTSALHCMLPSLAFETPVLRIIRNDKMEGTGPRYEGYEDFFNSVCLDNNDYSQLQKYNFNNPIPNPTKYLELRNSLIRKASEFSGFDNQNSLIENKDYTLDFLQMSIYNHAKLRRAAFAFSKNTVKEIYKKIKQGHKRFEFMGNELFEQPKKIDKILYKLKLLKCLIEYKLNT
ncbi:hypothetical protein IJ531_07055, partial [bacterium]|nr:hypothetical protein [bacterium]